MNKDEQKAANVAAMGQALGEVYTELWQEVARLFGKWEEYVELFGTKESRIALMNEAASDFFGRLQASAWHEVLLDITCLTDPPKSAGRETLSLRAMPALINDLVLKQHVHDLIAIAKDKSAFARDWRNRYLAHRDLALALGKAQPLAPASRKATRDALDCLAATLNAVQNHFYGSTTNYGIELTAPGGALNLLYCLDDGVRAHRERLERFKAGKLLPGDYGARDI
jgi:hypothetical protein